MSLSIHKRLPIYTHNYEWHSGCQECPTYHSMSNNDRYRTPLNLLESTTVISKFWRSVVIQPDACAPTAPCSCLSLLELVPAWSMLVFSRLKYAIHVSGMRHVQYDTKENTSPSKNCFRRTNQRQDLPDQPLSKILHYMIKKWNNIPTTYERAQALLHAERAGATTQTSERLTTTAIYTATKWCVSLTKNMLSKNFLYYTHSNRNLLQLPWVAEVPRVILIEYA